MKKLDFFNLYEYIWRIMHNSTEGTVLHVGRFIYDRGRTFAGFFAEVTRTPYKVRIFISIMQISLPNPVFDHLSESSR